ncbi:hypothetical protein C8J57DRAFT_1226326 [Mycena rebaudengoi]|nr:hypothetical protein C8J57DRAFT_1226326 [Mycena rebaudengoi]
MRTEEKVAAVHAAIPQIKREARWARCQHAFRSPRNNGTHAGPGARAQKTRSRVNGEDVLSGRHPVESNRGQWSGGNELGLAEWLLSVWGGSGTPESRQRGRNGTRSALPNPCSPRREARHRTQRPHAASQGAAIAIAAEEAGESFRGGRSSVALSMYIKWKIKRWGRRQVEGGVVGKDIRATYGRQMMASSPFQPQNGHTIGKGEA